MNEDCDKQVHVYQLFWLVLVDEMILDTCPPCYNVCHVEDYFLVLVGYSFFFVMVVLSCVVYGSSTICHSKARLACKSV